jgi:energy-converting hydrogenase B subunit P
VIYLKFIVRPYHIISLGGYIVEWDFPYRNIIVVNKTSEPIKIEIPVFDESWIEEHRKLDLDIIPVREEDNFLMMYKKAHAELDEIKSKL